MVVELYETVVQTAKAGTSGYQSQDEFNRNLYTVQNELMGVLSPWYAKNIHVQDLLSPFVESTVNSTGKPQDYFQFVSAGVGGHEAYPIRPNQIELYLTSPIRKPSPTVSYYCFRDNGIEWFTDSGIAGSMTYIRHPAEASIVLTASSTSDDDFLVATVGDELEWPDRAFNFLLYMMLQKFGIESKEQLLLEFSQIGLQSEAIKIQ